MPIFNSLSYSVSRICVSHVIINSLEQRPISEQQQKMSSSSSSSSTDLLSANNNQTLNTTITTPTTTAIAPRRRRIGIVGCGSLGQYLITAITKDPKISAALEIAFVWNRSFQKVLDMDAALSTTTTAHHCRDLKDIASFHADLIVEVCHPAITAEYGVHFLQHADFYCGSPTALADEKVEAQLREAATKGAEEGERGEVIMTSASSSSLSSSSSITPTPQPHCLFIPAGALWGAEDLRRMADRGSLASLTVSMAKHPLSLKLEGELGVRLEKAIAENLQDTETVLFEGSVRDICPLAPNNVNTMAAAAIAVHTLGFAGVKARLVCDFRLDAHVITIDAQGKAPQSGGGKPFRVFTERYNPAPPGAVTGSATYASFLSSLLAAATSGKANGVHMC